MKKVCFNNRYFTYICTALLTLALLFACVGCVNGDNTPPIDDLPNNSVPPNGTPSQGEGSQQPPIDEEPPLWASNFELPDANMALAKLVEIYGGTDKVFLLMKNQIARMPCPQGEVVTINATFDIGEYAKLILEVNIAEFNEVFAAINPNYKFAINYNPTEDDFAQKYSVRLSASNNLSETETSQVFGVAHVSYYNGYSELGDFGITIRTEVFNNGSYLATTFKHELMHLLGAGDAYKNSAATKATVMQSYTVNGYHNLSNTDVAFLDALYRNPEFAKDDDRLHDFVNGYEENCAHTKTKLISATYNKLVSDLDVQTLKNQAIAIGYKDLTDFFTTISDGITPDITFGTANVSFKEIEYAEAQEETYFGGIDVNSQKYTHGRQKGSMGNSQSTNYTNYGNGILYAAPNGNLYTIMIKTGDYVLAFRLGGSFTNFANLSLTLWHVSK